MIPGIPPDARRGPLVLALLCIVGAVLPSGCVDQAREVDTYRSVLDDHRPKPKPLQPGEALTLERAFALANADNEQIASQGETYLQALIAKSRAFSAFQPTVSFQPNFTAEQAPKGLAPAAAPGAPAESAAAVAASEGGFVQRGSTLQRLEAPVDAQMSFSFQSIPAYKGAKVAVAQQRQLLLDAQETVLLNVAQAFYEVATATRQVAVLEHSLYLQQERVRDLEGRFRNHLALELEVLQAKSNESATRVLLNNASNDMRNGRRTLALLIGVRDMDGELVDATLADDPAPPMSKFVDRALGGRQDLLAAEDAVKEARYAVDAAIAEYYPSLSLNVAGYLYREDYSNATKWDGILLANLPLFTAGQIRSDVREAWSRLRQAALYESYLRREIIENVRSAYDNFVTSGIQLAELAREVRASSDAYRQAVQQEKNGLAIPLDVLTAQDTLLNSELQYASESYTRTLYYLDLVRAAGELSPDTPGTLHLGPAQPFPADS